MTRLTPPEDREKLFYSELLVEKLVGVMILASGGPRALDLSSSAQREEILQKLAAGEMVELQVDAVTYIQRPTPNRNFVRFKKGTLRAVGKSFEGNVVLFNHDQWSVEQRVGTIVRSRAEKRDGGDVVFVQSLLLTDPRAVEGVLRGNLDRFSIGWLPTGPIECSAHGRGFRECWREGEKCWPGETVGGKLVEAVFTSADGIEVSFVNVPAVVGTGIENIKAALAANLGGSPPTKKRSNMDPKILKMLGLPADATEEQYNEALSARLGKLGDVEAQLASAKEARKDAIIDALYAEGKLEVVRDAKGARLRSEAEEALRALDVDALDRLAKAMPRVTPVAPGGDALQSRAPAPPARAASEPWEENPHLADMLDQVGLSLDDVKRYGPHHRLSQRQRELPVPASLRHVYKTSANFSKRVIDIADVSGRAA